MNPIEKTEIISRIPIQDLKAGDLLVYRCPDPYTRANEEMLVAIATWLRIHGMADKVGLVALAPDSDLVSVNSSSDAELAKLGLQRIPKPSYSKAKLEALSEYVRQIEAILVREDVVVDPNLWSEQSGEIKRMDAKPAVDWNRDSLAAVAARDGRLQLIQEMERACGLVEVKGKIQLIQGIPFGPDPQHPDLADYAQCLKCGDVVDVGGEMREHIATHIIAEPSPRGRTDE